MMGNSSDHIDVSKLFENARLKAALDGESQSHLAHCDVCTGRLSWMQTAADLGVRELAYEPPESILNSVLQLGRSGSLLKQLQNFVVAVLTFDSYRDPAVVGVRSEEGASRQMTYEADDVEIAVWVRRSENRTVTLTGQVLSKNAGPVEDAAGRVDLVAGGDHIQTTPLSQWGEFLFPDLPHTQFGLHVSLADRVVLIPSLPMIDDERR
jgi:hypothetical protein